MDELTKFRIKVAVKWAVSIIISIYMLCNSSGPAESFCFGFIVVWAGGELLEGILGLFGLAAGSFGDGVGAVKLIIAPFKGIINIFKDTLKAINGNVD